MTNLTIRPAVHRDQRRIAEILGDPGDEAIGIVGNIEAARRIGVAIAMITDGPQGWRQSTLAEENGSVVGVVQSGDDVPKFKVTPGFVWLGARTLGLPRLVRRLGAFRAMSRVQFPRPEGTYHIEELHVDRNRRGRGIGGDLLNWAETDARNRGFDVMSLVTHSSNPARRLYERHGFVVTATKTDGAFERYTGIAGHHLMIKNPD